MSIDALNTFIRSNDNFNTKKKKLKSRYFMFC